MAFRMSSKLKNLMLAAVKTALADGVIYIYSGTQPSSGDAAPTGTLLGIVSVGGKKLEVGGFQHGTATYGLEFGTAAASSISKASAETWQIVAAATGTAGWFRFVANAADSGALDSTETYPRIDGRISTTGAEMNLSNLSLVAGATTTVDSFSISFPSTF